MKIKLTPRERGLLWSLLPVGSDALRSLNAATDVLQENSYLFYFQCAQPIDPLAISFTSKGSLVGSYAQLSALYMVTSAVTTPDTTAEDLSRKLREALKPAQIKVYAR